MRNIHDDQRIAHHISELKMQIKVLSSRSVKFDQEYIKNEPTVFLSFHRREISRKSAEIRELKSRVLELEEAVEKCISFAGKKWYGRIISKLNGALNSGKDK